MPSAARPLRLLVRHSAAAQDVALTEELLAHLRLLERFAGIDIGSDARIRTGNAARWEIDRAIKQADVALVLLSSDFLSSDALVEVELSKLLARHRKGKLRVIPIVLRSCLWEVHPWLKELNPLPKGGKAIDAFSADSRDEVLTELVHELPRYADRIRGPRHVPAVLPELPGEVAPLEPLHHRVARLEISGFISPSSGSGRSKTNADVNGCAKIVRRRWQRTIVPTMIMPMRSLPLPSSARPRFRRRWARYCERSEGKWRIPRYARLWTMQPLPWKRQNSLPSARIKAADWC